MKSSLFSAASIVLGLAAFVVGAPTNGTVARRKCVPSGTTTASTEMPTPTDPGTSGGSTSRRGPIFSVYADVGVDAGSWPSAADLGDWNDFLLAFWMSKDNKYLPYDVATVWTTVDEATRAQILADYHAAGKTLRVSIFGSNDYPLTYGGDPTTIAQQVASFVKQYSLDGVDVDYEDSNSFNAAGDGENFLITLTKTLRQELPSPQYIISHAPQSPYFMTGQSWYPQGAYLKVDKEVGGQIDFYNVQFYNQGDGTYDTCDSLFKKSPDSMPGTSVYDIIASGVPASKLIVGKPSDTSEASNGYISPSDLGSCISGLDQKPGGVMAWQWATSGADWIAAAKGDL